MKKSFVKYFILLFLLFFYIPDCFAKPNKKELVTAQSAILVDLARNKIIYAKNIHTKLAPASTVKVLTALVTLEQLGANAEVEVSRNASCAQPSKIWLKPGEKYNSLDLINAALISSANDASVALAEAVAGSEFQFAKIMNKRAKSLGAKNSNFINATGLPAKNQYSTAYDLYRLVRIALDNPVVCQVMKKKNEKITSDAGKEISLVNHNKLLFRMSYPLVLGKTGYTKNAKHCYAGIAYYGKKKYAVVVLKSSKPWTDVKKLLSLVKN
ncbi:MAG: D-alanyl-D-alanine carboxypeptidase [Candidatus Omnitrophica bacterium]|nr:D-alanyl-D-alanine carboxypeptidase [Candidatus Omnitrophota bacterium]MDD5351983.1 D-alanyl-D-alanine carboxypeptidase [Candidatus Omnitrophota bacterium]MDD5551037.1 D-alanyl-D-alanine carboxypeptidase [Candidatus Omnitrophota bacterium]